MDKLDFVRLTSTNEASSSASWDEVASHEPLPPFGSLSFDLARHVTRKIQRSTPRNFKPTATSSSSSDPASTTGSRPVSRQSQRTAGRTAAAEEDDGAVPVVRPQDRFSPLREYRAEQAGPQGPLFSYRPSLQTPPAWSIAGRDVTEKLSDNPGAAHYRTARGFQSLSTSLSAPCVTLGRKTKYDSACEPKTETKYAGTGMVHRSPTKLDGPGGWTLRSRHVNLAEKNKGYPGPKYLYQDAHQRKLHTIPLHADKFPKFGLKVAERELERSPGPAAYPAADEPSDSDEHSEDIYLDTSSTKTAAQVATISGAKQYPAPGKSFGVRHSHLYKAKVTTPAPDAYDTLAAAKKSILRRAPTYHLGIKLSTPGEDHLAASAPAFPIPKPRKGYKPPAFTPMPNLPNPPSFSMGNYGTTPSTSKGPDPASYHPEAGLRATLPHSPPRFSFGLRTEHGAAVVPHENAANPSIGMPHNDAPKGAISFGVRHRHLDQRN